MHEHEALDRLGQEVSQRVRALFGRSLHIRMVDTGSCNGCEIEIAQLLTPHYDLQRYGVDFVASPRHADALLVTGAATRALVPALRETYEATPDPKIVIAVGACAISGGIVGNAYGACGGVDRILPVDVYIPGCPPRPLALLHGIMVALGRAEPRIQRRQYSVTGPEWL
jgi:Ni,Fe-hydrogenase III small subunit